MPAMTIVSINKKSAKANVQAGKVTYAVSYLVKFTGTYDEGSILSLAGAAGLPVSNAAHPTDASVYVVGIDADRDEESVITGTTSRPGFANYNVNYGVNAVDVTATPVAPWDRPAVVRWRGGSMTEVARTDVDGKKLVNSAGCLYDPLPERPIRGGECSITYNTQSNPATICTLLSNSVNSDAWHGVAAGNALTGLVEAEQQYEQYLGVQVSYWNVTVPMRFNNKGWRLKLIDNGYKVKESSTAKSKVHRDETGAPAPVPILLDGTGKELAATADPVIFPTAGYKYIEEVAYATYNLANPFS